MYSSIYLYFILYLIIRLVILNIQNDSVVLAPLTRWAPHCFRAIITPLLHLDELFTR